MTLEKRDGVLCLLFLLSTKNTPKFENSRQPFINSVFFNKHLDDLFSGLLYIHELNIVHLDIKPYNILFSEKVIIIK